MSNPQHVKGFEPTRPRLAQYSEAVATLWTYPAFGRLWTGLAISRLGDQFTMIALLWFVLQLTGSGAAVGLVILCFDLPALVTGPLLGMILDRYQPRTVMGLDNAARAGIIAAMPVLYWLGVLQFWHIVLLSLAAGALQPATLVGVRTYLPHLVPDPELNRANTLLVGNLQLASLIGPALAGALVAISGGPTILLLDALSFVIMAVIAFRLPKVARERAVTSTHQERSWLGFGPMLRMPDVRALTLLSVIFFLAYGPLVPAVPVYAETVLQAGAAGYGLLWSGYGVGAVLGLLLVERVSRLSKPGVTLAMIAVLWGAFLLPLVVIQSLPLAMFFLALGGVAWVPY
ncbi:MAG TPA: MFS transporter, partial [Anaerolineae bacterium]|nr:MFS transporter [Anaerolineae bacterium]